MPLRYHYDILQDTEIRLIQLFPAPHHDDDISLSIIHHKLDPTKSKPVPRRWSRRQLQESLSEGWEVFETPEGRYVFCYDPDGDDEGDDDDDDDEEEDGDVGNEGDNGSSFSDGDEFVTTWDHPNPDFDRLLYELPPESTLWAREPAFEALSYTWGSLENPGTAYIRPSTGNDGLPVDATASSSLPIGKNLESALRNLRSATATRTLWVDAVCINQDDDEEKAVQVVRMSDIYSLATRVVVWLGPEESGDDSRLAVSTLAHLGAQVETTLDGFRLTSPGAQEPTWYNIDVTLPYSPRQWKAIRRLISRPWFGRVWTAQEIQLANRLAIVQIGNASLSWSLFRRAVDCLKDKPQHGDGERLPLGFLTSSIMNGADRPFVDLLRRHAHRECSNPRDKIYGMLSLVPPRFAAAIARPSYSQPVADIYADAFITSTRLTTRWEIFGCDVAERSPDLVAAPSWVPDFDPAGHRGYFSGLLQFAAGNSRLEHRFAITSSGQEFQVQGLRSATVSKVGIYCLPSPKAGLAAVRSWEPEGLYTGVYAGTGEPLMDAFLRTLVQNDVRERNPTDKGWPSLPQLRRHCKEGIFLGSREPRSEFGTGRYIDNMIFGRCEKRVYIETEEGYIGLGPLGCRTGDVICVFPGCNVPVVLRPLPNGKYQLVGDSFVYGLNDGQALLGPMPIGWRVQVFDHPEQDFRIEHRYFNTRTRTLTAEDPRLGQPPTGWERVSLNDLGRNLTGDDPLVVDFFRNEATGEVINSDPRLLPEELEKRGTKLQWFAIT
ncbi:hypothetical protein N3K66_004310 [Trichothecium roseum]|uniref:Uncharacterized protein n=1 Tax=Trichothecium roseum TaxID=47278 RepID=A0ACC0V2X2_9HYPO|nr:hypothetical protein N3K66_004310 [Trichothecium roseum]